MLKQLSFTEFLESRYKSHSHGHELLHDEVNGLWYDREVIAEAEEAFIEYEWKCFINKIMKGGHNEKSNELDRSTIERNSSDRLSQRGKSSIRAL